MTKKRKRGERCGEGYTEKNIAALILDRFDGIKESEIRDWLEEKYGIKEKKGISDHLKKLKEKGIIIVEGQNGIGNIWKIKNHEDLVEFNKAIKFVFSIPDIDDFPKQNFLRKNESMINKNLLKFWGVIFEVENKEEQEKLLFMLRSSVSVFEKVLFEKVVPKKWIFFSTEDEKFYIKMLEMLFFEDRSSLIIEPKLKKSDFENFKKLFNMKIEENDGFCVCSYENVQKIIMIYSPTSSTGIEHVVISPMDKTLLLTEKKRFNLLKNTIKKD